MKLTNFCRLNHKITAVKQLFTVLLFFVAITIIQAQKPGAMRDISEPESSEADALCGPLKMVTICTAHLDSIELFYVKGMGMQLTGPYALTKEQEKMQKRLFDINGNYKLYLLERKNVPENIKIRVLLVSKNNPLIHKSYNAREMGPFTLGFPNANQEKLDKELRELGFSTMAPMQAAMLSKPDGTKYKYLETIYKAPEFVHVVGIERGNGMPQLAPYDSATLKGGPGYSAQIVTGISNPMIQFYTYVLGWEMRRDNEWKTGEGSALGIEAGVPFRFSILYAKGARSGHILLMDFADGKKIDTYAPPQIPNRGIGMYSFETKSIEEVAERAKEKRLRILQAPIVHEDAVLGKVKAMTLVAPNGVMVEIYQR
jgi:catechol 2,3-dioxygenase-like lactoylglutathione lyase family enzyme